MFNDCNVRLKLALLPASGFFLLCTPAADAEPQPQPVPQQRTESLDASTDPSDAEEESSYNGQDYNRPQRSFETRFRYQTSGTTNRQTETCCCSRDDKG